MFTQSQNRTPSDKIHTPMSVLSVRSSFYSPKQQDLMIQTQVIHMLAWIGLAGLFGTFIGMTQGMSPGFGAQLIALFSIITCIIATAQEVRNYRGQNKKFCNAFWTGFAFMCAATGSMLVTADFSHQLSSHIKFLPASFFIVATFIFSMLAYQAKPTSTILPKGRGITNTLSMILQCIGAIGLCYGALETNYTGIPHLFSADILTVFASVGCFGAVLASFLKFHHITKEPELPELPYHTMDIPDDDTTVEGMYTTVENSNSTSTLR